eukprot:751828-Hanusia_phi.AAC.1
MEAMNKVRSLEFCPCSSDRIHFSAQQYAQAEKSGIKADKVYEMVKIEAQKEQDEIAKYRKNRRMETKKAAELTAETPSKPSKPAGDGTVKSSAPCLPPASILKEGVLPCSTGQARGQFS